jgi:hypothetical protein
MSDSRFLQTWSHTDDRTADNRSQPAHLRKRIVEFTSQSDVRASHQLETIPNLADLLQLGRKPGAAVDAGAIEMPQRQHRSLGIGNVSFLVNVKVVRDVGRKAVECPTHIDANVDVSSVKHDGARDALTRINAVLRRDQIAREATRHEHSLIDERSNGFDCGGITATNDAKTNAMVRAIVKHDRSTNHGKIAVQRQQVVGKCGQELGSIIALKVARCIGHPAGVRLIASVGGRSRAAHGSVAIAKVRTRGHAILAVDAKGVHVKVVGIVLIEATEAGIDSNLERGSRQ